MNRPWLLTLIVWVGYSGSSWGGSLFCFNNGIHCICPPPAQCPDCGPPKSRLIKHCSPHRTAKAQQLIHELTQGDCCCRIAAARKLAFRIHADFCCNPEILDALVHALLCDSCWEVRYEAAWSIMRQDARVETGIMALYLASKLDPHYLVRDKATESLDILLVCRRPCFKDLFKAADEAVKKLRGKYKPGAADCAQTFAEFNAVLSSAYAIKPSPGTAALSVAPEGARSPIPAVR